MFIVPERERERRKETQTNWNKQVNIVPQCVCVCVLRESDREQQYHWTTEATRFLLDISIGGEQQVM